MTYYKLYKKIASDYDILFPLKEKEISVRKNAIPNDIIFHKKNCNKNEYMSAMDKIAEIYYLVMERYGSKKVYEIQEDLINKYERIDTDREITFSTIISVLVLSGYDKNHIITKLKEKLLS